MICQKKQQDGSRAWNRSQKLDLLLCPPNHIPFPAHIMLPWWGADIKSQESLAVPRQLSSRHIILLYCLCYLTLTLFCSAIFNGIMVRMGSRGHFYLCLVPSEKWGVFTEALCSPTLVPIPGNSKTPERNGKSWFETSLVEKPTCALCRTYCSQEVES